MTWRMSEHEKKSEVGMPKSELKSKAESQETFRNKRTAN
jgi:hypothetical protein